MIVRQFIPPDLMMMALQPQQRAIRAEVATPRYAAELAAHGESFTVTDGPDIIAVIGLIRQWDGCERAYALLSDKAGPSMLSITRQVRAYLEKCTVRRVEAAVQRNFEAGHRWARLLGFQPEGWMRKYWNDEDAMLYARVR